MFLLRAFTSNPMCVEKIRRKKESVWNLLERMLEEKLVYTNDTNMHKIDC